MLADEAEGSSGWRRAATMPLEPQAKVVRAVRGPERILLADPSRRAQREERCIEGLAAVDRRLLHRVLEDVDLVAANEVLHARRVEHDLERRSATAAERGEQALRDDAAQVERELREDLWLALGGGRS